MVLEGKISINGVYQDRKATRFLLGHFIEHLGRCIENGIWTYDQTDKTLVVVALSLHVLRVLRG